MSGVRLIGPFVRVCGLSVWYACVHTVVPHRDPGSALSAVLILFTELLGEEQCRESEEGNPSL